MLKEMIISELIEAGKTGASVYLIKRNDGRIEVTSNNPNCKSQFESAGVSVLKEINTSDEGDLDRERAIEIIECYYDDEELEEMEEN